MRSATAPAQRLWELDALRGLLLLMMTLTHLPTRVAGPAGQPLGYVSAAEGFVLLSAFMAGQVYASRARRQGPDAMQRALLRRSFQVWCCQAGLLLFAFTLIAALGVAWGQDAVTNLLGFYLQQPLTALWSSLMLIYSPALLDILPMYVLFLLASPMLLRWGMARGWSGIVATSLFIWLLAQLGLGQAVYGALQGALGLSWSYSDLGAFSLPAWQLLWVLGLWMGADRSQPPAMPARFPPVMLGAALAFALGALVWRHLFGQVPVAGPSAWNLLFDKWQLGPWRLMNVMALLILLLHFGPRWRHRLPRLPALELLGRASLPVFCAHLVVALIALAVFGQAAADRPWRIDLLILGAGLATLYGVAWVATRQQRALPKSGPSGPSAPTSPSLPSEPLLPLVPLVRLVPSLVPAHASPSGMPKAVVGPVPPTSSAAAQSRAATARSPRG